jgi:hypothetical protein
MKHANITFIGKPEGEKAFDTHSCKWEDNINSNLRAIG